MTTPPWFALPTQRSQPLNTQVLETPVIVVGAGLAGCHIAFALAQQNVPVLLLDAATTVASGASANDAGIVKPFVTRDSNLSDQFYRAAFDFLLAQVKLDEHLMQQASFKPCGVLQLLNNPYPQNPSYDVCASNEASALAGVALDSAAIHFGDAGWLNPAALCHGLVQHNNIDVRLETSVHSIEASDHGWLVNTQSSNQEECSTKTLECHQLILATGEGLNKFSQTSDLPITPARGQTSRFSTLGENPLRCVITGKRYVIPDGNELIVGASFKRDTIGREISMDEHEQNKQALIELLPSIKFNETAKTGFTGIRATTPDRLPVVGPMPNLSCYPKDYALLKNGLPHTRFPAASYYNGLSVIGGFGSRGIVSAPYCAKLLADYLTNRNTTQLDADNRSSSNEQHVEQHVELQGEQHKHQIGIEAQQLAHWSSLLHPGRFMVRALKRA